MSTPAENVGGTPPGQTIVLERRERGGCLRWGLLPILLISLFLNCGLVASLSSLITPNRLQEVYVAGDLSPSTLNRDKIAIVEVDGVIADTSVEHAIKQLKQARDDSGVMAVVLRVDSPGGTVSGADRIWREVELLVRGTDKNGKDRKPVVVSMGGMAASGGYYVSAPADLIFAEPTTMTGSIGVILEVPQLHELLEKIGVDFETITTGEFKDMGSMFRPMTESERARWREVIDSAYQRFVRVVAHGRKLPLAKAIDLANGKVYTSEEALELKLIDRVGYLDDAIQEAQRRAKLSDARVIRYARPSSLETLLGSAATSSKSSLPVDRETLLQLATPQMLYLAR
jgi:protease-4